MKAMKKTDEIAPQIPRSGSQEGEEDNATSDKQKGRLFLATEAKEIKEDEIGGMDYDYEEEFDDDDEALFDEETEQVWIAVSSACSKCKAYIVCLPYRR
jgi:hypothetical protein